MIKTSGSLPWLLSQAREVDIVRLKGNSSKNNQRMKRKKLFTTPFLNFHMIIIRRTIPDDEVGDLPSVFTIQSGEWSTSGFEIQVRMRQK